MSRITWNYHCHTNYTDGLYTVREIAAYCDVHGVEEIAITEHVQKELTYNFDQLLTDISMANKEHSVHIFSGVEAKILHNGTLDCPEEIKDRVDMVIGSVHGLGGMSEGEAYEKLAESDCKVIGHPQFFSEKMIASLVKSNKVVELSNRYEQSDEMLEAFRDAGLLFSIGLDSHRIEEVSDFEHVQKLVERLGLTESLWRPGSSARMD